MKEFVKVILSNIVYFLYKYKVIKNKIKVASIDETLDELIHSNKSIVRFGDSDIVMLYGRKTIVQDKNPELSEKLKGILHYENDNLIVGIPDIFESLSQYSKKSKRFWKIHLLSFRNVYEKYCNPEKIYYNAFLSRMYYNYEDKNNCGRWIEKFKNVWSDKDIVFVEGAGTHNGVGNDLFSNAKSIERVICPPQNAYFVYNKIVEECKRLPKDKLILVSLGSTAKVLTSDLFNEGYRVLDIGNLDMEYEWFIHKATDKIQIAKHSVITEQENIDNGFYDYLKQIRIRIL